ncbi:MAG: aldehyde dehydrogenase family protein [Candidatus Nanopelagicales bacterium]|jgi:gamma-glutamyl-gamma-aminobutyraldehyde dehydrogenase|nr:aldehyde dehydrogenase family protein [Candidatus Nanopelagicales bacterium]
MAFPGVVVPLVTPFTAEGVLDVAGVPPLVDFVLAGGVRGVVVAGTTGEGYALDLDERRRLLAAVRAAVAGRVPVLVGIGGTATRDALAQARLAAELGADGLMVAAPAYVLPTPEELGRHVRAVLDAADLPAVLYDYPDRTGVAFTERALDLVAADPRVVGIKEASGDLTRVGRLRRRYGADLSIVCGSDTLAMRYFEKGVDAWIAGVANALPAEHVALLEAAVAGRTAEAWAWQKQLLPMVRTCERVHYIPKVRHALALRGLDVGPPRAPLEAVTGGEAVEVAARLAVALGGSQLPSGRFHGPLPADAGPLPIHTGAYIDGAFAAAADGATMPVTDPSTGAEVTRIASGGEADIDRAVRAARDVFERGDWSRAHPGHRRHVLTRFAKLIERHAEDLARLDSLEAGKPITDCRTGDLPETAQTMRWFAEAIDKRFDRVAPTGVEVVARITSEPIGVVGAVLPWNFPALMFAWKVAPALAMGNSVVVKPAEQSSLSALLLASLGRDAGLPKGVLNVVPGLGERAGAALGRHPDVDMVTFTGSTEVGRHFLRYAAESNLKRVTLECGGKSPQIVLASARDLDEAAREAVRAAFWNMGENCSAGSRILVERSIHGAFVERLARATADLRVGHPSDPRTEVGPLIDPAACDRSATYVARAVADGARVVCGGTRVLEDTGGWYFAPTVLDDVPAESPAATEEIFGPVVVVIPFDTEEQAIALANATSYGLAASLWTDDVDAAHRIPRLLRAGTVSVNCYSEGDVTTPFGGWRQSGFGGRDKGLESLDQYCELKTTWLKVRW